MNLAFLSISRIWRRAAIESAICAAMVAGTRLLALRLTQSEPSSVRDPLLLAMWPALFAACGWFALRGLRPRSRAAVSDDVIADMTSHWISPSQAKKTIPRSQQPTVRIAPSPATFASMPALRPREPIERIVNPAPAPRERSASESARPSVQPEDGALPTRVIYHVSAHVWSADPNVVTAETSLQLNELCDALQALRKPGCRTVRIASASNSRYAKSQIAAQLATMLAEQPDTCVLLLEADLDAPALHHVLKLSVPRGLGHSEQLQRLSDGGLEAVTIMRLTESLHALIESRWGSPSLFESPQFAELVKQQRNQHDLIIIDGPIVDTFCDADVLASAVDHVVFVVASGTRLPDALTLANKHFAKESMLKVIRTGDWTEA